MKGKNISFADVLKTRSKSSLIPSQTASKLSDLLMNFDRNPQADYTLYLSGNANQRSYRIDYSRNTGKSRGNVFDSWIQKQSGISNKQNIDHQPRNKPKMNFLALPEDPYKPNLPKKGKQPTKMPTKIMAGLKSQNSSHSLLENQQRNQQQSSKNIFREDSSQEIRQYGNMNRKNGQEQSHDKGNKNIKQNDNLRTQLQKITERKVEQINNLFSREQSHHQNSSRLQELIASTQNIHTEIANLAKKYARERQLEQEELLLLSGPQQTQNRRWEEAKNMVNGFLDKFTKGKAPTSPEKPQQKPLADQRKPEESQYFHLQVGYSFAGMQMKPPTELQQYQSRQNQMIDQISEIGSEQASQRISDSGQFDFARNGVSSIALKINQAEMGLNKQNVSTLVENLKQEFEEIKRDWE